MHFSRAPPPTPAARRSYRRTGWTSSSSTAACPAAPRRGCQLARPHRGRTPLSPPRLTAPQHTRRRSSPTSGQAFHSPSTSRQRPNAHTARTGRPRHLPRESAQLRSDGPLVTPDRPAMYHGGTCRGPPIDLRRHRAGQPRDHADASGSADERSRDQPSSRQRQKGWPAGSRSTRTLSCGW
jgi:hypothetical protein